MIHPQRIETCQVSSLACYKETSLLIAHQGVFCLTFLLFAINLHFMKFLAKLCFMNTFKINNFDYNNLLFFICSL